MVNTYAKNIRKKIAVRSPSPTTWPTPKHLRASWTYSSPITRCRRYAYYAGMRFRTPVIWSKRDTRAYAVISRCLASPESFNHTPETIISRWDHPGPPNSEWPWGQKSYQKQLSTHVLKLLHQNKQGSQGWVRIFSNIPKRHIFFKAYL